VEFIRLHARRGFYQNPVCMTFSRGEGLITSQFFSAISREEGYEERSESYLASWAFFLRYVRYYTLEDGYLYD